MVRPQTASVEPPEGGPRDWFATVLVAATAVAAAGGLILRFWSPSPLWLDEALSVNIASLPFSDMVEALRHDGHPILYYLFLGWWIDVFGDSNLAVRSLSGVFSAATVPVLWMIGRRFDPRTARIALILALSAPFLIRYGTEARMYSLVVLLVAVGWLVVLRAIESPTGSRLLLVALAAAALVHTHYWNFWLVAASLVALLWHAVRAPGTSSSYRRIAAAIVIGSATLVVWLGVLYDQATSTGTPWAGRGRPAEVLIETIQAIGGSHRYEGESLGILLVLAALVGTFALPTVTGRILMGRPIDPTTVGAAVVAATTLAIGGAVALATASAFEPRYAAVVIPFVTLLAARGMAMSPRGVAAAVVGVVVVTSLAVGIDEARRDRTQAGDVAAAIDASAASGDVVIFCPDQIGPSTLRELKHELSTVAYPSGSGRFVDWADYLDRIASVDPIGFAGQIDQRAGSSRIWMVTGQSYRGFDGRCDAIIDTLATRRSSQSVTSPSLAFEAMALRRFEGQP